MPPPFDQLKSESSFNTIRDQSRRGNFSNARGAASQAFAAWKSQPDTLWHWKFKLLYAELLLFNGDTREASALLKTPPPAEYSALEPRYTMLRGYVLYRNEDRVKAELTLENAAGSAHRAGDFELEADADLILATYSSAAESDRVEQVIESILRLGREHNFHYQMAAAWIDYGMLRIRESRFAEAIPYFEQASLAASRAGATLLDSIATGDIATCYDSLGDYDRGLAMRQKAIEIQKHAGLQTPLRNSYLEIGRSESQQGNAPAAIANLRQALSLVNAADSPDPYSMIAVELASVLISTGSVDEAQQLDQRALLASRGRRSETHAAAILNEGAIAERRGRKGVAAANYLQAIGLGAGSPAVLWSGYAALGALFASEGKIPEARTNFEAALHTIDASRADQLQSRYKITFLSRLIRFYQEYVDFLIEQGDPQRALDIADSSRAGVLTRDLVRGSSGDLLRRVGRMSQQTGTTFLFYWLAPRRSWLWIIHDGALKTFELPDGAELAAQVQSYRYLIEREKIDSIAASHRLPSRLFTELVGPAAAWIPKGSSVVIVPDDALHSLNFESLVVDAPQPHYWLEDVTVAIAPSLGLLTAPSRAPLKPASLLLIGDPEPAGTGFAPLPDAASEMQRILQRFPRGAVSEQRGAAAVPAAYRDARPKRFSAIHFAAHAEANEQSPLDSAIILSMRNGAYRLYAHEIMEVPLTADLVTISACRGAGARTLSGEGLVGFAWAFFQAGAKNVVAGLWDVNDRSTSDLMDAFYAGINVGQSYPEALRQAKLALLKTAWKKPYYWAPFQLYSRSAGITR